MRHILITLIAMFSCNTAFAFRIEVDPRTEIYAYELTRDRALYDVLVQNLWILNDSSKPLTLQSLSIKVLNGDRVLAERHLDAGTIKPNAEQIVQLNQAGLLDLYDIQFRAREKKADGWILAPSGHMAPAEALLLIHQYLTVQGTPDTVLIIAEALGEDGSISSAEMKIDVKIAPKTSEFIFPLEGDWFIAAGPDARGHHRWIVASEFALDIVKLGENGATFRGSIDRSENYLAYGASVRAVAAGEVISVRSDIPEDETLLRQPGETLEAYESRSADVQIQLLTAGESGVAGNHVVIRHDDGQYSQYAHLRPGSVRVEIGDQVAQGDEIAELGNSGNSSEPHLHFQMTNGPDVLYSRGIPVTFKGVSNPWSDIQERALLTGDIVRAE